MSAKPKLRARVQAGHVRFPSVLSDHDGVAASTSDVVKLLISFNVQSMRLSQDLVGLAIPKLAVKVPPSAMQIAVFGEEERMCHTARDTLNFICNQGLDFSRLSNELLFGVKSALAHRVHPPSENHANAGGH